MKRSFCRNASSAVVLALAFVGVNACADVVAVEPSATRLEAAVRAPSTVRALSGSYSITSITLETRYWDASGPLPNSATAATVFNGLSTTHVGYTNEPYLMPDLAGKIDKIYPDGKWTDTSYVGIRNPEGAYTNIATRYRTAITALKPSVLAVQFGVDFLGGAMFVDGSLVAENWKNPWWYGFFRADTNKYVGCTTYVKDPCLPLWVPNPSTLWATVSLTKGSHMLEVIGFENGDDGGAAARIDAGGGYQPLVSSVQPAQTLTLSRAGAGGGRVVSTPAGIACTTACGANFPLGSTVSLTATAVQNAVFAGWTGRCSGVSTCTVRMYGARTVGAEFIVLPSVLSMTIESRYWDGATFLPKTGAGAMAFFDNLPKNVPGYTNEPIPVTTLVRNAELFAPPTVGASLSLASRYVVHLSAVGATPITFRFSGDMSDGGAMLLDGVEIALNWSGSGSGPLLEATAPLVNGEHTIQVVGFEKCCDGATPLFEYNVGTGWIAVIAPPPPPTPLIVSVLTPGGVPGGRITSAPAGIDCGPSCQSLFPTGSQVTLSATPNQYFAFTGWGGSCTGTTACVVRMLEPGRSVTSGFVRVAYPVTVSMTGTGTGSVALSPSGGTCGSGCWTYSPGTSLTLTATPDANSLFGGWSVPGCTGTTCTLTVNADLTVSARFDRKMAVVTVVPSGSGSGTVTSSPAGINCGTICAASFAEGSTVKLAAQPAPGSSFDGWSGACTGTGPCSVTAAAGVVVTPTFSRLADTTPPTLSCVATPKELWPVNHKMVDIRVAVSLADAGSGPAGFTLLSVTSNEPDGSSESPDGRDDDKEKKGDDDKEKKGDDDKGSGDGKSLVDILGWNIGTADVTGQLRAERAGNRKDRVYTMTYRALDNAGNSATTNCTVVVPHDQR